MAAAQKVGALPPIVGVSRRFPRGIGAGPIVGAGRLVPARAVGDQLDETRDQALGGLPAVIR
jgi:hypothetical protein